MSGYMLLFVDSHKYQKFPAQETSSTGLASSSPGAASAAAARATPSSHSALASQTSSVSLHSAGSATSLNVDVSEKSFVPRQKLLMMAIDDKTVSDALRVAQKTWPLTLIVKNSQIFHKAL